MTADDARALRLVESELIQRLREHTEALVKESEATFDAGTRLQRALQKYGEEVFDRTGWAGIIELVPEDDDSVNDPASAYRAAEEPTGPLMRVRLRWDVEVENGSQFSTPLGAGPRAEGTSATEKVFQLLEHEVVGTLEQLSGHGVHTKGVFYVVDDIDEPLGRDEPVELLFQ